MNAPIRFYTTAELMQLYGLVPTSVRADSARASDRAYKARKKAERKAAEERKERKRASDRAYKARKKAEREAALAAEAQRKAAEERAVRMAEERAQREAHRKARERERRRIKRAQALAERQRREMAEKLARTNAMLSDLRARGERDILLVGSAKWSLLDVEKAVCEHAGATRASLQAVAGRSPPLVNARHAIWFVARHGLLMSLTGIGMRMNRDHSSILYGIRRAAKAVERSGISLTQHAPNDAIRVYEALQSQDGRP
ncbi:helix-turn-helix domain-containing protein [Camelimonas abortus]|uniref:Helix-turn-helix domain-containing protein n=1 Tax=Camelimonas abortus TaxID=1017184 RepID=A0ABV7LHD9_9HYPH